MEDPGMSRPLLVVALLWFLVLVLYRALQCSSRKSSANCRIDKLHIPFVYIASNTTTGTSSSKKKSLDHAIQASVAQFRNEASQAVQGLSRALETALELESHHPIDEAFPETVRLSTKLKSRISLLAECLETQEQEVLEQLLLQHGLATTLALPDQPIGLHHDKPIWNKTIPEADFQFFIFTRPRLRHPSLPDDHAYDSAGQIIAHLVRDWTTLGKPLRCQLYDWCLHQLQVYHRRDPILVPGAGMGRLAYEIYRHGFTVEANELSPVMAAAAQALLMHGVKGRVYPFLLDRLWNEVDSNGRFDSVAFPDCSIMASSSSGSLSFTIGDFGGTYYRSQRSGSFGAVVTCFFLDTASNVYDYIQLIEDLLTTGGVWINVGPLQWHANALLFPAADELKELVNHKFRIVHWAVDDQPLAYRDATFRTTNFDGYRPLRFVAIRS